MFAAGKEAVRLPKTEILLRHPREVLWKERG